MTLIEVLIVIGIVTMLAAMIVPVFSSLVTRHEMGTCMGNLKNLGQALLMYRADYLAFPPDVSEWWVQSKGQHGLGLAQLHYAYWAYEQAGSLNDKLYAMPAGDYLPNVANLHCPHAPLGRPDYSTWTPAPDPAAYQPSPYLGGYNAYDWNYRRDRYLGGAGVWLDQGLRNLLQPFPPDDTVITWCPLHRSKPPQDATDLGDIRAGDHDLVLFADGSVESKQSRYDQYKATRARE